MEDKDLETMIILISKLNKGQYERLRNMMDIAFGISSKETKIELDSKKLSTFIDGIKEDS